MDETRPNIINAASPSASPECDRAANSSVGAKHTRRDIVRHGIKLAFTAPLITTFLASDAHAAASRQSCYPAGHACGGGELEPCCNGACAAGVCP